ncbi:MAG: class I SAM-dependent methyltransferase [Muribaculaceae bacterium]|nr:class I SAM-dependent methyltransferase [Muribaculaceae bacterium]
MKLIKYYDRASNPRGFWGKRVLKTMNSEEHQAMPEWALDGIQVPDQPSVLDVGCGGGANIRRMLKRFPGSMVSGLDHSPLAIDFAYFQNLDEVLHRCIVMEGDIENMYLGKEVFDLVTAFETVYYWVEMDLCLARILRVLKPGGTLLIANELDGDNPRHQVIGFKAKNWMHVYSAEEMAKLLNEAGFANVGTTRDEARNFIRITGQKNMSS